MAGSFRCLSVRQPWAWAILSGAKDIENRTWKTDYRGAIVIHAGSSKSDFNKAAKANTSKLPPLQLPFSALVGVVDVVDIVPLCEELESNNWAYGPYCWKLANPRLFAKPIPAKGKLNLYTLDAHLAAEVEEAMPSAKGPVLSADEKAWLEILAEKEGDEDAKYPYLWSSYFELNDPENALRMAEIGVAKWGDTQKYVDRALAKGLGGELEGALEDIASALKLDSENARAYFVRSLVNENLDRPDLAAKDMEKAKSLDSSFACE